MNTKELIEGLRKLPAGGKIDLERSEFETIFHDSEPVRRAQGIAAALRARAEQRNRHFHKESEVSDGRRSRASAPLPLSSSSGLRSAQMNRLELLANTWNAVASFTGAACDATRGRLSAKESI